MIPSKLQRKGRQSPKLAQGFSPPPNQPMYKTPQSSQSPQNQQYQNLPYQQPPKQRTPQSPHQNQHNQQYNQQQQQYNQSPGSQQALQSQGQRQRDSRDPRKIMVDKIIHDCYSRYITLDGQRVHEAKYNTHVNIREYSSYPQTAPPGDLSPAQIGPVKNRILVLCTKHNGRPLLQKGKYNDEKRLYQIGRTWDLAELSAVTRVGTDAMVLSLNKDYYWKCGEGPDRLVKFMHHVAVIYNRAMGRYPALRGVSLEVLGLDSKPEKDLYKDMDFTVNGKLPMKAMQVMDVDRPSPSVSQTSFEQPESRTKTDYEAHNRSQYSHQESQYSQQESQYSRGQGQYSQNASHYASQSSLPSETSFVFGADTPQNKSMATIHEYAQGNGRTSPLRDYKPPKPEVRTVSDNLETSAQLVSQLYPEDTKHVFDNPLQPVESDDIEEITDSDASSKHTEVSHAVSNAPSGPTLNQTSTRGQSHPSEDSVIDTSIKEIEDFMDTQFGRGVAENDRADVGRGSVDRSADPRMADLRKGSTTSSRQTERQNGSRQNSIDSRQNESRQNSVDMRQIPDLRNSDLRNSESRHEHGLRRSIDRTSASTAHDRRRSSAFNPDNFDDAKSNFSDKALESSVPDLEPSRASSSDKDPEVDELLDEIGWNATDGSDTCIKSLRNELNMVKHKNVVELSTLDFGKDSLNNEVKTSSQEVDNLIEIFKRMEAGFNMIAPKISEIEHNSKGLQVEAINVKILYNDLKDIVNMAQLSSRDLQAVANYDEFDDSTMVPLLEGKLLTLYTALVAIGSKSSHDDLSQMQALKQFHERYLSVAHGFIDKFDRYILGSFQETVSVLSRDVAELNPYKLLSVLHKQYEYAGVMSFVQCTSEKDLNMISSKFSSQMAGLVDKYSETQLKAATSGRSSGLFQESGMRKKSGRFGSSRLINRVSNGHHEERKAVVPKSADEIADASTILKVVKESEEMMLSVQFFLGRFFHTNSMAEFNDYVTQNPFEQRMSDFERRELELVNYKTNANTLLQQMNLVFGNYINKLVRALTPAELIVPQLLIELYYMLSESNSYGQDFVSYSFLSKLIDKYRGSWSKFISNQVDLLDKSDVRAKGDILPAMKNLNQIITATEASVHDTRRDFGEATSKVSDMVQQSYKQLTTAVVKLFSRTDPLLKSNTHDDREKAYRNVSILQNLYGTLQLLQDSGSTTGAMRSELSTVFDRVQDEYFVYIFHRHFHKLSEFVKQSDASQNKRDNKILVRSISSTHTDREMSQKIDELHRKLEKHFITSNTVMEQDLLRAMWRALEQRTLTMFQDFLKIARTVDKGTEGCVTPEQLRRLFGAH